MHVVFVFCFLYLKKKMAISICLILELIEETGNQYCKNATDVEFSLNPELKCEALQMVQNNCQSNLAAISSVQFKMSRLPIYVEPLVLVVYHGFVSRY